MCAMSVTSTMMIGEVTPVCHTSKRSTFILLWVVSRGTQNSPLMLNLATARTTSSVIVPFGNFNRFLLLLLLAKVDLAYAYLMATQLMACFRTSLAARISTSLVPFG